LVVLRAIARPQTLTLSWIRNSDEIDDDLDPISPFVSYTALGVAADVGARGREDSSVLFDPNESALSHKSHALVHQMVILDNMQEFSPFSPCKSNLDGQRERKPCAFPSWTGYRVS
jgi:hypothetical protein